MSLLPPKIKNRLSKRIFGSKQDEHQSLGPLRALSDGHPNLPKGVLPPHLFAPICGSAEYHPNQFSGGRARQLDDGSFNGDGSGHRVAVNPLFMAFIFLRPPSKTTQQQRVPHLA